MPERDSPRRTNGNAVANPRIRACSPTSSRPALSSARSIVLTNFTLVRVEKGYPVRIMLDLGHQSSAIRCRFVNRFARPKVLSHVARQRFSPRDAPLFLDRIPARPVLRCHQYYEGATTSHSRIPGHLFVSLPGPTRFLLGSCSPLPALPGAWRSRYGPGSWFSRRSHLPARSHVDVSGTSQVPRRPILRLCPVPRPRPDRRTLAITGSPMLPLLTGKQRLQRNVYIEATARLRHLLSTLQERCCHRHMQDSLPVGWLAFTGWESNPLDRDERFLSSTSSSPFPEFILTLPVSNLGMSAVSLPVAWRGLNAGSCPPLPRLVCPQPRL